MSMIHKFSMNGYNIVLDVNGGAVHVVDEVAYNLVDLYKEKTKEEIKEDIDDIFNEISEDKDEKNKTEVKEENKNYLNLIYILTFIKLKLIFIL